MVRVGTQIQPIYRLGVASDGLNPVALNADTTYGTDDSLSNNYGVGKSFISPDTAQALAVQRKHTPSPWWLILALVIAWWCFK